MAELSADDLARGRALLANIADSRAEIHQTTWPQREGVHLVHSARTDALASWLFEHRESLLSAASDLAALKAQIEQWRDKAVAQQNKALKRGDEGGYEVCDSERRAMDAVLALLQQPEPPQEREK